VSPLPAAPRRPDRLFAAIVLCAWLPVALFAIAHHEMWRDELHCWLVARDSATPWAVVHQRAYDGQPPLWYLLLWVLQKATHHVLAMQIAHVALAAAVVWVFAERAPFPRAVRALFPFGYFLAYEYVAISRCYGLALLLVLLLCANHRRRFERPVATGGLLAALALTTTVATMVAAAYAASLVVDALVAARRRDASARRAWIPVALAAAGGLAAGLCAWPPADSTVTQIRIPHELPSDDGPTRIIAGLLPVPRVDFFFWNSNALLSWEPFRRVALLASILLAAWVLLVVARSRTAALVFALGSALLVALFALVYGGDVRHHGFFFVLLLMAAWIARESPQAAGGGRVSGLTRFGAAALVPTLAALLAVHVSAAAIAIAYDTKYVFSSGARAARFLRANGLADGLLVAELDFPATAVLGQLDNGAMAYSPRTGRPFSFVKWTPDRHWDPTDEQTLRYAAALGAARDQDAVLLMNRPLLPELVDGRSVVRMAELYDSMIEEENFYIYRVSRAGTPAATAVR
jgi:hypothetical protein